VSADGADVAAGIREFDTPDMDFAGQCRKAAASFSKSLRSWTVMQDSKRSELMEAIRRAVAHLREGAGS